MQRRRLKFTARRAQIELPCPSAYLCCRGGHTMRITVNGTNLYFDVEGPELAVERRGLRARPTLVVLHGGPGFDHGYLRPGLAPLGIDAQLVFVDLRGQGRSATAPAEECTLEQMADDVAALCGTLGIERPLVFGHSAGGFVALHLALRHQALAGGLVLCHTAPTLAPLPDPDPPASLAQRAGEEAAVVAGRLFAGDMSAATGEAFERLVFPHYAAPAHQDVPGRLMALSSLNPDVATHFFTRLAPAYDLREHLGEIDVPTLVIVGAHDWVCPPAAGRAIASAVPGAELVVLGDAGHFGFSESPEPFLAAVRAHLARLLESRGPHRTT
jgi:proline iminopeptidase